METTQDYTTIARFAAPALGIKPQVFTYYDQDEKRSIDVMNVTDPIDENICIYCTIGVSDSPNVIEMNDGTLGIPVELLIAADNKFVKMPNILSTCGFYILKNEWPCQPGTVFKNMVTMYYQDTDMKHILFTRPYLWQDKLHPLTLEQRTIHFLLCIPISDKELEYKNQYGTAALEEILFQDSGADIYNINRHSVV